MRRIANGLGFYHMQRHSSGCPRLPRTGSRRIGAGAAVVLLAVTLGQTGATPPQDRGPDPEAFSGIPWQSLEELPQGLAAVRRAATIESRTDRQKALSAIADDPRALDPQPSRGLLPARG